jgi:hypothetical protein
MKIEQFVAIDEEYRLHAILINCENIIKITENRPKLLMMKQIDTVPLHICQSPILSIHMINGDIINVVGITMKQLQSLLKKDQLK